MKNKKFAEGLIEYLSDFHYSCDCTINADTETNPYDLHEAFEDDLEKIMDKYVDRISSNIKKNALEVKKEVIVAAFATGASAFAWFWNQAEDAALIRKKLSEEEYEKQTTEEFDKMKDYLKKFGELNKIEFWIPEDPFAMHDFKDVKKLFKPKEKE
jgi:antibiotic biosynthesis monooxygenase (ABM) superfamily enzyme